MKVGEAVLVTGSVLALGVLDHGTGDDLCAFVFYFVPVAWVTARHGPPVGYGVSGLCAATWFLADWLAHPSPRPWMGGWNAAIRVAAFVWVAHLVGRLRGLLAAARQEVRTLRGLLPICAQCKQIRDAQGTWQPLEVYLAQHADVQFSHGLCDQCLAATLREVAALHSVAPRTAPIPIPGARRSDAGPRRNPGSP